MDGGYPQGGGPPPQMMGYYNNYPVGQPTMPPPAPMPPPAGGPPVVAAPRALGSVSIWAGDLDSYMDENFLRNAVAACGWGADITRIKVVRDRFTGTHAGYGFLDAASPEAAQRVLAMGSGMPIPGSTRCWRLNMGRSASGGPAAGNETNVYVGDLEPSVTEFQLMSTFRPRYASVRHAKVVCNEFGHSRGFGFVRFADPHEAERAVSEMQGFEFNQKPIRLSPANGRSRARAGGVADGGAHAGATNKRPRQTMAPDDPNNTTLFIGGTANHITEDLLWREFSCFGELDAVRVPANKTGFAFVRFKARDCAQRAKDELGRTHVVSLNAHKPVRLEWATEQIAVSRPPPAAALAGTGGHLPQAPPPYEAAFTGADFPPAGGVPQYRVEPVRVPTGAMPLHGQPGVVGVPPGMLPMPATAPAASMPTSAYVPPPAVGPGGPQVAPAAEGDEASATGPGAGATMGETEPPSKRAAVERPEYTGEAGAEDGGKTEAVAAPFSWLSSGSSGQAPGPAQQ